MQSKYNPKVCNITFAYFCERGRTHGGTTQGEGARYKRGVLGSFPAPAQDHHGDLDIAPTAVSITPAAFTSLHYS